MSDIVERLRNPDTAAELDAWGVRSGVMDTRMLSIDLLNERKEAADEIERLRLELASWEGAASDAREGNRP
jgi:hypothetical protein